MAQLHEQPDAVDKTLARLDTPYIDLLLIHPARKATIWRSYRQMEKGVAEGKGACHRSVQLQKEQNRGNPLYLRSKSPLLLQT